MLNVETMTFPARFYTNLDDRGEFIDYKTRTAKGVWHDGVESKIRLDYFIRQHNAVNKANVPDRPYQYATRMGSAIVCPTIKQALEYAGESAQNMFGRDESRGIVNRAVVHPYNCGAFKFDEEGEVSFNDASIRNAVIGDSIILGGVIHSAIDSRDEQIKELEEQVSFLTGRLEAVSKAMRSEGEDVVMHAKVLRSMADALVNIWRSGK